MDEIFPSIPLSPKPGATKIPSNFDNSTATLVLLILSEWIGTTSIFTSLIAPAWTNDSKIDLFQSIEYKTQCSNREDSTCSLTLT